MATPPKVPTGRGRVKKTIPAAPVPRKATQAAPAQGTPFVIEAGALSAFVDRSDAALSPVAQPSAVVDTAAIADVPATSQPIGIPEPVAVSKPSVVPDVAGASVPEQPVETPPVEAPVATKFDAPTPPQPVVVEPVIAAIKIAADRLVPNALEGHHIMNEAIETGKKFAEDAKARLQTMAEDFSGKTKVAMEKSSKAVEELSDIAKGNVEALVESSKIAAKGVETLGQSAAEYGRASFEKTSATFKSFASVKSPVEFFQLQSALMTSAFDAMAAESAKNSEAFLKLAGEIAQPLSNRAAVVSDKLKALTA